MLLHISLLEEIKCFNKTFYRMDFSDEWSRAGDRAANERNPTEKLVSIGKEAILNEKPDEKWWLWLPFFWGLKIYACFKFAAWRRLQCSYVTEVCLRFRPWRSACDMIKELR